MRMVYDVCGAAVRVAWSSRWSCTKIDAIVGLLLALQRLRRLRQHLEREILCPRGVLEASVELLSMDTEKHHVTKSRTWLHEMTGFMVTSKCVQVMSLFMNERSWSAQSLTLACRWRSHSCIAPAMSCGRWRSEEIWEKTAETEGRLPIDSSGS